MSLVLSIATAYHRIAITIGIAVAVVAGTVLVGWVLGADTLVRLLSSWPQMVPATAWSFIWIGVGIACVAMASMRSSERWARVAAMCGTLAAVVAGLRLLEYAGMSVRVDQWPFWIRPEGLDGRMSPLTAVSVGLLGIALVFVPTAWSVVPQVFALGACLIGWLGFSRFIYGGEPLLSYANMAAHTSTCVVVSCLGLLIARPTVGLMQVLASDSTGGHMLRRMLPLAMAAPIILGWLRLEGQRLGWYGLEAGLSLFAVSNVLLFTGLAWFTASGMRRSDLRRRAADAQVAATVAGAIDSIVTTDRSGRILGINPAGKAIFGVTLEGAVSWDIHSLIDPADHPRIERELAAPGRRFEAGGRTATGQAMCLEIGVVVLPVDRADHFVWFIADITERKHAEAKVHAQLARLDLLRQVTRAIAEHQDLPSIQQVVVRTVEESLPLDFAAICTYDRVAHCLTVCRVGTRSAELAMTLALTEQAVVPIDRNGLSRCVQGQLVHEPDIAEVEFPFPRRLAQAGLRSLVFAPLITDSMVVGVLVAARRAPNAFTSGDCEFLLQLCDHVALAARHAEIHAALLHAYEDLRQTQQAAMQHERLRALGQMASGVAHDINNALSPIMIGIESILNRERSLAPRARQHLEMMQRATEDIAATVGRLREFYRQRDMRGSMVSLDVNNLVQQVLELTQARWHDMPLERGIEIQVCTEMPPGIPCVVGVESELRETLTNLVFNAVDAMPGGGTLTLRTACIETPPHPDGRPTGRVVRLEVIDTGVGMDAKVRQQCLDPFFTTKGERGTGLGLAIVYGILQRHGAELDIDSEPGRGTTFRIDFTVLATSPTPGREDPGIVVPRLRILLVDDDPLLSRSLSDLLVDEGHDVTAAPGGQAGIDLFVAEGARFDVVITDLGMPRVDGRRVAAAVKAASPGTPVILLTGWGQRLLDEGEAMPHIDRVLSKPARLRELRSALLQFAPPR